MGASTSGRESAHTRVLKQPMKRRSIDTASNTRKALHVLDSYRSAVCSVFEQAMEEEPVDSVDPTAFEAVDLIVADFVERLMKRLMPCDDTPLRSIAIKKALETLIAPDSALFTQCIGIADSFA
eukprot:Gregarina_sp_Poly_1__5606@NODE_295_length_9857_cov_104_674974_g255_i0_p7_GENE_NODE_295_length_9857_cov_104_674974_g255_i0NODE_295_length_9857_cov_104_674974_g255_i0_p7_ORF_typecomplete_len124_score18_62_NODE_295_length_9857_cov_104_674974_g255_i061556526